MIGRIYKYRFTFMEVIAVMVIIVLLSAILLPIAVKSREWGKSIQCKNNIRNIGNAIMSYTNDANGYVLSSTGNIPGGSTAFIAFYWTDLLIDPYSSNYTKERAATPKGSPVNKKNIKVTGAYIPLPNVRRDPVTAGSSYKYCAYVTDYSSVLACPSEPINWRNETLTKQMGITSATDSTYLWTNGSHYAIGLMSPLMLGSANGWGKK